jgi:NAD(P)H-flavin reductase
MQAEKEAPSDRPAAGVSLRKCLFSRCTDSSYLNEEIVSLEFAWSGPFPRAGQFFMIKPEYSTVFLARPISVAGWQAAEGGAGILRFLIAKRGRGTEELTRLKPGEGAELSGPLGNSWADMTVPESFTGNFRGTAAFVSGGAGVAPLACYAQELDALRQGFDKSEGSGLVYDFYAGFKSGLYGLEKIKPRSLIVATEDGSEGLQGRVPDFFSPVGYGAVFACGPEIMLKVVASACAGMGTPCFVSMEQRMACGTGACLGCTIKTWKGNRRCCADGPIFNAEELCFEP